MAPYSPACEPSSGRKQRRALLLLPSKTAFLYPSLEWWRDPFIPEEHPAVSQHRQGTYRAGLLRSPQGRKMLASPPSELPPWILVEGLEGCRKHPHQYWEGPCSRWGGRWKEWEGVNQSRGMELPPPPKPAFGLVQPGVPLGWGSLISHESIDAERAV